MIVHTAERHADHDRICCLPITFLATLRVERGYVQSRSLTKDAWASAAAELAKAGHDAIARCSRE
jgi:hypothetical protein